MAQRRSAVLCGFVEHRGTAAHLVTAPGLRLCCLGSPGGSLWPVPVVPVVPVVNHPIMGIHTMGQWANGHKDPYINQ